MKRILILTPFYKPFIGGAERFAEELVMRCPPSVALTVYTARIDRHLPRRETINNVVIYRLGFGCAGDKFLFPFLAAAHAIFLKYDRVHAVMASYAGAAAFFIYWLKGTPYVLTLQSGTLDTPEYASRIRLIYPLYKAIHCTAQAVHAVSGSLRSRALLLGVKPDRITVIPNGIDCLRYTCPTIRRLPRRIVAVARLESVKGVRYAVEAMIYIIRRFPDATLWIAGDGTERAALESLVAEKNLGPSVSFVGALPPDRVPAFLAEGAVFICPSLAEGFGIAVLEAMASGCAVVASNVGGIPDIVTDGADGLLVPPEDARSMADAVIRILTEDSLRTRLTASGMARAHAFNWDVITPRVFGLWQ